MRKLEPSDHGRAALLAAFSLCCLALDPLADHVPHFLLLYVAALFVLLPYVLGLKSPFGGDRRTLVTIVLWAFVMRLPLLVASPSLSDDVYRYVWEGRVTSEGIDPFDHAPIDPALAALAESAPEWSSINHRELPAIYPPGAQLAFAGLVHLADSEQGFRLALVLLELLLIVALARLLVARGQGLGWVVLYAWHPLAVVEVAGSGHYEPLAMLPLVAGLVLAGRWLSWPLWGLALSLKFLGAVPAAFVAVRLLRRGRWLQALLGVSLAGMTAAVLALPFALDGRLPLGSLGTYLSHWGHNASIHALLSAVLGYHPARKVVFVLALLWALFLLARGLTPARGFLLTAVGVLLLSPVVHPWYGLWLLVMLPLFPGLPLFLLSGLLPLSYLAWTAQANGGAWTVPGWALTLEYGLPLVALAWGSRSAWFARGEKNSV